MLYLSDSSAEKRPAVPLSCPLVRIPPSQSCLAEALPRVSLRSIWGSSPVPNVGRLHHHAQRAWRNLRNVFPWSVAFVKCTKIRCVSGNWLRFCLFPLILLSISLWLGGTRSGWAIFGVWLRGIELGTHREFVSVSLFGQRSQHTTDSVACETNLFRTVVEARSLSSGCRHGGVRRLLRVVDFLLCLHTMEGTGELSGVSIPKAPVPFTKAPPS